MEHLNVSTRSGHRRRKPKPAAKVLAQTPDAGEELYRKIFDHSNDAIFVIDPGRDKIVDVNPGACSMLGYTREELLSTPISAVHPSEMPRLRAFARSVFKNGRGWTNELTCLTKDGKRLPAEISASTIDVAGRTRIIAMVRDIAERREVERAQRELAVAEERNRLAREIHDSLAQGLTAIIWQLNAAEPQAQAGGDGALRNLGRIRELARECLRDARRSVWDLRSGPLTGMSLVEALRRETDKVAGGEVQVSFSAEGRERTLPAGVEASLLRICQEALANILKHASPSRVMVTVAFDDDGVRLSVADNGVGFDPGSPGRRDKDRGGFGLVSMRERATLLGGELTVRSSVGAGTTIEAALPLK